MELLDLSNADRMTLGQAMGNFQFQGMAWGNVITRLNEVAASVGIDAILSIFAGRQAATEIEVWGQS